MRHKVRQKRFRNFFLNHGYLLSRSIKEARVRNLLVKLRPQKTGYELLRVGGDFDGGYLLPDDIAGISAVFSPGVGAESSFESFFANAGAKIFMADPTVDQPVISHPLFYFEKKFISGTDTSESYSLNGWIKKYAAESDDLILQMDIEGAEYSAFLSCTNETLEKFRVIVCEFHNFEMVFSQFGFDIINEIIERLTQKFIVAHIHPNNTQPVYEVGNLVVPTVFEVTLLRRDRVNGDFGSVDKIHHPLDSPCNPYLPDKTLPKNWPDRI